jgi:mono/diheme cytochrome c family protein
MSHPFRQCVCLGALLIAGCQWPGQPRPVENGGLPTTLHDFALLFEDNCRGCHGDNGKGGPAPPLNDAIFLHIIPEEAIVQAITSGRPGTPMPAFSLEKAGRLEAFQISILAKGMKEHWGRPVDVNNIPPYAMQPGGDPKRGAAVFAKACSGCHGHDGEGGKHGDMVVGANHDQSFLALTTNQMIRRIIITGRPDLGMPNFAEKTNRPADFQPLTAQEVTDLTAHVNSWRKPVP